MCSIAQNTNSNLCPECILVVASCNVSSHLVLGSSTRTPSSIFHLSQSEVDFIVSSQSLNPVALSSSLNSIAIGVGNFSALDFVALSHESIEIDGDTEFGVLSLGNTDLLQVRFEFLCLYFMMDVHLHDVLSFLSDSYLPLLYASNCCSPCRSGRSVAQIPLVTSVKPSMRVTGLL